MPASSHRPFSLATIDRIFLKAGCPPPGKDAAESLGKLLAGIAGEILETAKIMTGIARRKTITSADITLAFDQWKQKNMRDIS
ncbi:MAG: histone [Candidatus Lokiarchaeota archaeon]|nr:histone [Candidatus Lokiarchaeota archaeon]